MKNTLKFLILGAIILALGLVFFFQKNFTPKEIAPNSAISVRAISVNAEELVTEAQYVGVIKGESLSKLSFQVPGKISTIYAKEEALVKKGDPLADIEPNRLELGTQASQSQVQAASSQLSKANDAYAFAQTQYDNVTALFASGGASQNDLDKAKLSLELAASDRKSAEEQRRLAQVQGQQNQLNLKDAVITAPFDGYVVDWLAEVGEITGAGYPVVVFRAPGQVIEVAITQKDYESFAVGTQVEVIINDETMTGQVTQRENYPDAETRTFAVKIAMESSDYPIGSLCKVKVKTQVLKGVKLPIMSLLYNGTKQVYQVIDKKVQLIDVEVLEILDDYVIVSGITDGTVIVTEGIKRLKPGDSVVLLK